MSGLGPVPGQAGPGPDVFSHPRQPRREAVRPGRLGLCAIEIQSSARTLATAVSGLKDPEVHRLRFSCTRAAVEPYASPESWPGRASGKRMRLPADRGNVPDRCADYRCADYRCADYCCADYRIDPGSAGKTLPNGLRGSVRSGPTCRRGRPPSVLLVRCVGSLTRSAAAGCPRAERGPQSPGTGGAPPGFGWTSASRLLPTGSPSSGQPGTSLRLQPVSTAAQPQVCVQTCLRPLLLDQSRDPALLFAWLRAEPAVDVLYGPLRPYCHHQR